eukprot:1536074-Lingulodinium_polyedra.AAC.1
MGSPVCMQQTPKRGLSLRPMDKNWQRGDATWLGKTSWPSKSKGNTQVMDRLRTLPPPRA